MQFQCANGRIILSMKYHQWNRSLIKEIVPLEDFVTQVNTVLVATSNLSHPESTSPSCSSGSSPAASVKRRNPVSIQSPSKRCKHIKDSIDEDIEIHKKGIIGTPHSY